MSWPLDSSLVDVPGLVSSIVAVPVGDVSHVVIVSTVDIEALSSDVSNVSD